MLDSHLPAVGLLDRDSERDVLERLVAGVRAGESRVLVMRGEAGVGKTALFGHLTTAAEGCRIARAAGVESEMELAFAGLHALCAQMLGRLRYLPSPQRDALSTAFGLSAGPPPDRFLVGLAVLSLLADAAEERPLVCIVDDAQWLDRVSAQTLAFVARRLLAERVGLVFAMREYGDEHVLDGLPEVVIEGLTADDARQLLNATLPGPLDKRVRERILAEAGGNPLALLELPRGLKPVAVAGGFGLPGEMPLASRIEQSFLRRLEPLPAETRRLLLLAAAEPVGSVPLLWRAAEQLGIAPGAAGPAEAAGLLEIGARVRFRHPLVRSAAYRAAAAPERRDVHRALADAIDPQLDPDRRAWHRAHAADGPDEAVAEELERSAGRAQARGGLAAAAAFLEQAMALTPDPARRGVRALAAAEVMLRAGGFDAALVLLTTAEEAPLDALPRARIDLLRAQIAFASSHGGEALSLLLAAARKLEPLDNALARATYLEALYAADLTDRADEPRVALATRHLSPAPSRSRMDLLLDGMTALLAEGYAVAAPIRRRAVRAFRNDDDLTAEEGLRWLWLASFEAAALWDDEGWWILSARYVDMARAAGALSVLPLTLHSQSVAHVFAGELDAAASLVAELDAVQQATGTAIAPYAALTLAAWRGREQEVVSILEATLDELIARGEGLGMLVTQWARAVLANGLGRYDEAVLAAREAADHPHDPAPSNWALSELVEAATRSGQRELAADAFARLEPITRAGGTDWALGIQARAHALLSDGEPAERLYHEAIERLGRTRLRGELARARLLYGEWLRREHRRVDAREQLRAAHEMLSGMGAQAFAERARRELLATGETVRRVTPETRDVLTPQETQIARLAAEGETNPEIGARLFISPRTVEYHLRKVYTKLGVSSRRELRSAFAPTVPTRLGGPSRADGKRAPRDRHGDDRART
jgi:DNA-binding CsgD family transcriptional regulator